MEVERYHGQIVRVGDSTVMTSVIAGAWAINYIEFPADEWEEYRNTLLREKVRILRVLKGEGVIVFE